MKVKLFILLCFVSPFLKGGHLFEQLNSIQDRFYALPQNLTIEGICSILDQIGKLGKNGEDITEKEDTMIMELRENGMFLKVLKDYMTNPSDKGLTSLKEWAQFKPDAYDFLEQAIEKNPENEALKNINLNFPTWWDNGYVAPQIE